MDSSTSSDEPSSARGSSPERAADAERPCSPERSSSASPSPEGPAAPCGTETGGGGQGQALDQIFNHNDHESNSGKTELMKTNTLHSGGFEPEKLQPDVHHVSTFGLSTSVQQLPSSPDPLFTFDLRVPDLSSVCVQQQLLYV